MMADHDPAALSLRTRQGVIAQALGMMEDNYIVRETHRMVGAGEKPAAAVRRAVGTCGSTVPVYWLTSPKGLKVEQGTSATVIPWREVASAALALMPLATPGPRPPRTRAPGSAGRSARAAARAAGDGQLPLF